METKTPLPAYTVEQLEDMADAFIRTKFSKFSNEDKADMLQVFITEGWRATTKFNPDKAEGGVRAYQTITAQGGVYHYVTARLKVLNAENVSLSMDRDGEEGERETVADLFAGKEESTIPEPDREKIMAALAALPADERDALIRTVVYGETDREVGKAENVTGCEIWRRRGKALSSLRYALKDLEGYAA